MTGRADFLTAGISLLQGACNGFSGDHIQACLSLWLLVNGPVTHRALVSIPFPNHLWAPPLGRRKFLPRQGAFCSKETISCLSSAKTPHLKW